MSIYKPVMPKNHLATKIPKTWETTSPSTHEGKLYEKACKTINYKHKKIKIKNKIYSYLQQ